MFKTHVRYLGDPPPEEQLVAVHPADEMRAKRELSGKQYVDTEYRLYYHCWLAAQRSELIAKGLSFDAWLDTVSEVEPVPTEKGIAAALMSGLIEEKQAEYLRSQLDPQGEGLGESVPQPS